MPIVQGRGNEFPYLVGFIGLGNMGGPMAVNIAKSGFNLEVFDIREEATRPAVEAGARKSVSVPSMAEHSEIIEICVLDDNQVINIILGPEGIMAHGHSGQIIVIHSTIMPITAQKVEEACRSAGIAVLDACVSGGDMASKAGTLTLMVGGDQGSVEKCRPLFETVGSNIFHAGPVGAGAAAKLSNNLMLLTNNLVALEAMKLAKGYGIDEKTMVEIAKVSTGNSWMIEHWGFMDRLMKEHTLAGTEEMYFLLGKDLWDAINAARDVKVSAPLAALAFELSPSILREREKQQ